jgi:trimethylamine:corrinoid methyltransferase-like protein
MRRLKRGMEPHGDTLGIDAIRQGLKEGNFLTTDETLRLYKKEAFYPSDIIDRKAFKEEGRVEAGGLVSRARAEIEMRLAGHTPPDIAGTNLADMKSVMEEALAPFGIADLAEKCMAGR